jgi:hypothetical protein
LKLKNSELALDDAGRVKLVELLTQKGWGKQLLDSLDPSGV